jgi:hypothetical protein
VEWLLSPLKQTIKYYLLYANAVRRLTTFAQPKRVPVLARFNPRLRDLRDRKGLISFVRYCFNRLLCLQEQRFALLSLECERQGCEHERF